MDDLDAAVQDLVAQGHELAMSARTASGLVFHFVDTRATLGHMVELYEPTPGLRAFYSMVRAAAEGWDGVDPVRTCGDASVREAMRWRGVVDDDSELPQGDALLVGELPSVRRVDDHVVIVASVQPLGRVRVAGERRHELAVDVDPSRPDRLSSSTTMFVT